MWSIGGLHAADRNTWASLDGLEANEKKNLSWDYHLRGLLKDSLAGTAFT